ncbi:MAG: hypothetical protein JW993_15000 [Sedimentisphaerales bacterium]|nr:hypothetical protein [Sedimentisphaerales bacterium]
MKTFWQHRNGKLYAVKHDTFGHMVGVAGPLDWDDVQDADGFRYGMALVEWVETEIRRHAMHRMHPALLARTR